MQLVIQPYEATLRSRFGGVNCGLHRQSTLGSLTNVAFCRRARRPPLLKRLNERTVLEAIRDGAPISRAEISRRAGISKPTVSLALQSLLDAGLVRRGRRRHRTGRATAPSFFEPVAEAALVLGLDLGARFLRGAICDLARRRACAAGRRARRRRRRPARSTRSCELRDGRSPTRRGSAPTSSTASSSACPASSSRRAAASASR